MEPDDMDAADKAELAGMRADLSNLIRAFDEMKHTMGEYSTKEMVSSVRERVSLLEKIVFGGVAVVVLSVLGGVIAMVIKK